MSNSRDNVVVCERSSVVVAFMTSSGFGRSVDDDEDVSLGADDPVAGVREAWKCGRRSCVVLVRDIKAAMSGGAFAGFDFGGIVAEGAFNEIRGVQSVL